MGESHREPFRSRAAERAEATCFDMSRFDAIPLSTHEGTDTADVRRPGKPDGVTHHYRALAMCMIGCAGPPTPSKIRMYHSLVVASAFLAILQ
jgi:hypothetical protein